MVFLTRLRVAVEEWPPSTGAVQSVGACTPHACHRRESDVRVILDMVKKVEQILNEYC